MNTYLPESLKILICQFTGKWILLGQYFLTPQIPGVIVLINVRSMCERKESSDKSRLHKCFAYDKQAAESAISSFSAFSMFQF